MNLRILTAIAGIACLTAAFANRAEESTTADIQKPPHWRHPIALVTTGDRLYLANQRSGSISILTSEPLEVFAEIPIGGKLSDLAVMQDGRWMVAVDEAAHQLLLLEPTNEGLETLHKLDVAKTPVSIAIDSTGRRGAVASLWSRRVTLFELENSDSKSARLKTRAVVELPFAPRKMLWLAEPKRLIVADAFGGRLTILDPEIARVVSQAKVAGHNIRGLALSGDGKDLLISQQVLNSSSKTTHTPVFWGDLMQNVLRSKSLSELLSPEQKTEAVGDLFRTEPLGHPSAATGDPYDVRVLPGGQTVVSLSGVGEIAIRPSDLKPFERFSAQARSTALLLHPDGKRLLVANAFADSITIFDLNEWRITGHLSLGPTPELTQIDQGEHLFYDANLSLDGWYSCHSCHTDGHTTGHRNDNLSDQSYGAPKRILPLGGVGRTGPWAWNGESNSLVEQIHSSIRNTMQGEKRSPEELQALEAYLQTLKPAPSLDEMRGTFDKASIGRGGEVFRTQGCADCHQPPTYTSPQVYDVGLSDELGRTEFNPPSLLGVSQRQDLFHDGRARSLEDVLEKFQHGEAHKLSDKQRADLIDFLRSL